MASVVPRIQWRELLMFDHWPNISVMRLVVEDVPIIALVNGYGL